jgi:hypothetical protein
MLYGLKGLRFLHRFFHESVWLLTDSKKNTEIKASFRILNLQYLYTSRTYFLCWIRKLDILHLMQNWRFPSDTFPVAEAEHSLLRESFFFQYIVFDGWSMMIYGGTQLPTFRNKLLQNGRNIYQQTGATLHKTQVFINKAARTSNVAAEVLCSVQLEETRTKCRATSKVCHISIRWIHRYWIPSLISHHIN